MPVRWKREWLSAGVVLIAIVAGSGAAITVLSVGVHAQVAECSADPTTVEPGETVTLDASNSDANFVEFDKEGDGEYELVDETDFIVNVSYETSGIYDPIARADGEDADPCGTITVNEPPSASVTASPNPATTGKTVTFDASDSTDSDGEIVEYRWDFNGDGTVDNTTSDSQVQHTYTQAGGYDMTLTVVDDDGATESTVQDVIVEESVVARCTVEPTSATTGETVTIDATDSENGEAIDYDVDGDGEYEVLGETSFKLNRSYETADTYSPRVRVRDGDQEDTADCGTVSIEEPNEPPVPELSISPRPGVVGQPVTFDASNSTDPDGRIVEYRWDFNGDGTIDNVTNDPITTNTFQQADLYIPSVTVIDDDNATGRTADELPIQEPTQTPETELRCTVDPSSVSPGEPVVIEASESTGVNVVDYDVDGDGEYERRERTNLTTTVVYEEPGTYEPRVRVRAGDRIEECGTTTVEEGNQPPIAVFTVDPFVSSPGEQIVFNASDSFDPDGEIVKHRWDFNGNGTIDAATNDSLTQHTYSEPSRYRPALVVVDNDGATDRAELTVRVVSETPLPGLQWLLPGILGGLLGIFVCRVRRFPKPFGGGSTSGGGVTAHAAGTFETPPGGGTVTVDGLGFEPDLLLFTATTDTVATERGTAHTDAWTYGKAMQNPDGSITQNVVSVADDAGQIDAATGGMTTNAAIDLRVYDNENANSLLGSVKTTTADGFEIDFDASSLPNDVAHGYTVMFQAYAVTDSADIAVGHAPMPEEPGTQSIPIGFEADHAVVTATNATDISNESAPADDAIGVSHGEAVSDGEAINQQVVTSSVDPQRVDRNGYAASDERIVHLFGGSADDPETKTSACLTSLDGQIELDFDEISSGGVVTFLAIDTGERGRPAIGHFDIPAPEGDNHLMIDVGFEPRLVEFTACNVDAVSGTRTIDRSPLSFGWSHGSATIADDLVSQYMLHGAFTAADPSVNAQPLTGDRARVNGGEQTETVPTGMDQAEDESSLAFAGASDATAAALVIGADGQILGRDEVRVTGTTPTGFSIEVRDISTHERGSAAERRPVVFYKAWPKPEGTG